MTQEFSGAMGEQMSKDCVRLTRKQLRYLKLKRFLDIVLSFCGLLLLTPVFLAVAAAIKLDTPACSVLYSQSRIGRNGAPFRLYKFRSMQTGAPELSTKEFTDADQYVTRVGKFIRITSLDELPQLWNVLIGDMSLIGPRPLLRREQEVHKLRFAYGLYQVRPGITGLAQTRGRDALDDIVKVSWDRRYVQHLSLYLDVQLLLRTVVQVVRRDGVAAEEKTDLKIAGRKNNSFRSTGNGSRFYRRK